VDSGHHPQIGAAPTNTNAFAPPTAVGNIDIFIATSQGVIDPSR
jgi:hypothetical protein